MPLIVNCLSIQGHFYAEKSDNFSKINLEVNLKVVPLHSHLKNGWLMRLRVL